MRARLRVPTTNDRAPLYTDHALSAIHQANPHHHTITLGFGRFDDGVALFLDYPPSLKGIVEGQLAAHYPECRLDIVPAEHRSPECDEWIGCTGSSASQRSRSSASPGDDALSIARSREYRFSVFFAIALRQIASSEPGIPRLRDVGGRKFPSLTFLKTSATESPSKGVRPVKRK